MRIPTMCLALLLLLAAASPALADPIDQFDKELELVEKSVSSALTRVKSALASKNWNAWCPAHEIYVNALNRGVIDIESAVTRFLFAVLNSGKTFDADSLTAIDDAAWLAGDYAHRRVLVNSWSLLAKRGVPPNKRGAALDLLARQGVYDGKSISKDAAGPVSSCDPGPGASPHSGRVPGSPEAAQALSKWQYAYMQAETARRTISMHETELITAKDGSKQQIAIQKRLDETKAKLKQLEDTAEEWRRKYFQEGGR